ncbi:MAG: VOC family protein [Kordiimonadaceae bacterium]|jgi:predicted lactoylglutathione lyase|nr:VOC family protein [Kordiimonadaceae bacterium]
MLSYAMVGTKDLKRAGDFYDKIFDIIGAKRAMEHDTGIMWSDGNPDKPFFGVCLPHDGNEATAGNGTMISFSASSKEQVKEVYDCALANGAICEGEPGMRGESYYLSYFRDPDGNKFSTFFPVG